MIEWLHKRFPQGSNYLVAQKNVEEINNCMSRQLILPACVGRKHSLWGESAQSLSAIGNKIGWVPNKLHASFFTDTVEMEIADACAAKEGLLKPDINHMEQTREILMHFNFLHFAPRNPYFLSDGETKILWFLTQWIKQPDYMIIGHLPSSLSARRTQELVNSISRSMTNSEINMTIILGYVVHQKDWFSELSRNHKWKNYQQLHCP